MTKKRLLACLVILLVVGFGFLGRHRYLPSLALFLDISTPIPDVIDLVIPLPGDDNTRTMAAAALVRIGRAERVAVLQGVPSLNETDEIALPGAEITRRVLIARGVDPASIIAIEGESASTVDDLRLIGRLWDLYPDARVAIVSNSYHLRRVRWSARRVLPGHCHLIAYVAAPIDEFDHSNWWQSEMGFSAVASEYVKMIAYVMRYGTFAQRLTLVGPPLGIFVVLVLPFRRRVSRRARAVL